MLIGRKAEEGQIKVHSRQPLIRSRFDLFSRGIRTEFRRLMGLYDSDDWRIPIEVYVYGTGRDLHSGPDIIEEGFLNAANRFVLRLKVKVHDEFDESDYRLALVRILILEQMLEVYAERPTTFDSRELDPPDWLVHGFDQRIIHREMGRPSDWYAGFLRSGQMLPVEELVEPDRAAGLTPMSLEVFRASASVLVGALCEQRNSGESLRGLLGDIALAPDARAETLIRKHFPALRETDRGIEKWWALELASLARRQTFEFYSATETRRRLEECLSFSFPEIEVSRDEVRKPTLIERVKRRGEEGGRITWPAFEGSLADYPSFLDRPDCAEALRKSYRELCVLRVGSLPLFRQVISGYLAVIEDLVKGDTGDVGQRLAELQRLRQGIERSLEATRDYLNHYEAARAPRRSEAFDGYFEFRRHVEGGRLLPPRSDAISEYMDRVERHGEEHHSPEIPSR